MVPGIALIALVIVGLSMAFYAKKRAELQSTWPRVHGTVIRSAVEMGRTFIPVVEYQYVHEGRVVRANRVCTLSVGFGWPGPARRVVLRHPVGSTPDVYVDPKDPDFSVLEPGGDPHFLKFVYVFAAVCAYAGVRMLMSAAG